MDRPRSAFPQRTSTPDTTKRPFLSVSATAQLLGMSEMTLYRAIAAGEFPAVRVRGRLIVPTRAIDEMVEASLADGRMVDAADWVPDDFPAAGRYADDRGSVSILPLVGFVALLLLGTLAGPFGAGLLIVVAVVAIVVTALRSERRANTQFTARFDAWQRYIA